MGALERVVRPRGVVEGVDLEGLRDVTSIALVNRIGQPKLTRMDVHVAAPALPRDPAIALARQARAPFARGAVATFASGGRVRAGERPDAVIDLGRVPSVGRMTARASPFRHLFGKLVTVRVVVAVGAFRRPQAKIEAGPLGAMTSATGHGLVLAFQGKIGARMLRDRERRGPEAFLVVTRRAVRRAELSGVCIPMAIGAARVLQTPVAASHRKPRQVTPIAGDLGMHSPQRKVRHRVGAETDPPR